MKGLAARYDVKGDMKSNWQYGKWTPEHDKAEEIKNLASQRAKEASGYDKIEKRSVPYGSKEWNNAMAGKEKYRNLKNAGDDSYEAYYNSELANNGYNTRCQKIDEPEKLDKHQKKMRQNVLNRFNS